MLTNPPELSYLDSFRWLAERIVAEHERQEAVARATHGRFNVFTTILPATDERRLHTRFLHGLLDPDGSHDCGSVFLDLFFATLAEVPPLAHDGTLFGFVVPPDGPGWRAKKEVSIPDGQLDILIERSSASGFAIENKIDAGEQPRQIARYAGYLEGRRFREAPHVFFLTPDGRPSVTHEGKHYLRISYADHVLAWLEKCLAATYAFVPINQVLLQYREVVRLITGKTLDRQAMNTVAEFICSHPEIVRHWQEITEGIGGARALFLDRLVQAIGNELTKDGFLIRLRAELIEGRFGVDPNGAFIITPPPDDPLYRVPFEIWVEHVRKWQDAMIIGIESSYKKAPISTADQDVLAQMNASMTADANASKYQKVDPRATWDETWWPVGSHNLIFPFDDAKLAELLAQPLAEIAREYADEIRTYIRKVAAAYDVATRKSMIRFKRTEP